MKMITKKRIEEIKNSKVGSNVNKEFEDCIIDGDKLSKKNKEFFEDLLY